jgi:thiol-disulfide isomerase/thioredoxin
MEAIHSLSKIAKKYVVVAFLAEWCKDCASNIPALALVGEVTSLEVRVFGGIKIDPLSQYSKVVDSAFADRSGDVHDIEVTHHNYSRQRRQ